jgi:hypothetical protein
MTFSDASTTKSSDSLHGSKLRRQNVSLYAPVFRMTCNSSPLDLPTGRFRQHTRARTLLLCLLGATVGPVMPIAVSTGAAVVFMFEVLLMLLLLLLLLLLKNISRSILVLFNFCINGLSAACPGPSVQFLREYYL